MGKLTLAQLRKQKATKQGDRDGLFLLTKFKEKSKEKAVFQSWVLRIQADKQRRDIGRGVPDFTPVRPTPPGWPSHSPRPEIRQGAMLPSRHYIGAICGKHA